MSAGEASREISDSLVESYFVDRAKAPDYEHVLKTSVAGIAHDNPDGSSRQQIAQGCKPFERVYLVREPDCKYDANAIKVVCENGSQLGYIPRKVAAELATLLDAGRVWIAHVTRVTPPFNLVKFWTAQLILHGMKPTMRGEDLISIATKYWEKDKHKYDKLIEVTFAHPTGTNPDGTSRQDAIFRCKQFEVVMLQRCQATECPGPHAIAARRMNGECIGFVPDEMASELAPGMDAGDGWFGPIMLLLDDQAGVRRARAWLHRPIKEHVEACNATTVPSPAETTSQPTATTGNDEIKEPELSFWGKVRAFLRGEL
jgi:HIRAN domain